MMKKRSKIILLVFIIVCVSSLSVYAAGSGSLGITSSSTEVKPGDTITVTMSVTSNPGIGTLAAYISYDPEVFTLESKNIGGLLVENTVTYDSAGNVGFDLGDDTATANVEGTGAIGVAVLKVKDTAAPGTSTISAVFEEGYDVDVNAISMSGSSVSITIPAPVHEHTWGDWTVTTDATCAAEGAETRTCTECGETETRAIPKLTTHTWGDWTVTAAASCTADGVQTRACSVCGEKETKVIPAMGHKWDDGKVTTAATCMTDGVKTYTCQNDAAHTRTETIAALGHDWGEWTTPKEATITEDGAKTRTCARCGEMETEIIPAEGYKFLDGMDSSWTKGSGEELSFRVNGELAKFDHAEVDGTALAEESYTTAEGSTLLKLNPTYLDTLSVGSHTLTAVYSDGGKVSTTFSVKAKDSTAQTAATPAQGGTDPQQNGAKKSPQTGDETPVALWLGAFILCGGTAALLSKRKFQ